MHCPQCGQQQISDELPFCTRCGFPLSGVAKLVAAGGIPPSLKEDATRSVRSPRRKGVQQGVILILIGAALLPLINVSISPPYNEALLFLFLLGGVLRTLYALIFQEGALFKSRKQKESVAPTQVSTTMSGYALPPSRDLASNFVEPRVETAEMVKLPDPVTENTTKLLDEQDNPKVRE